MTHFKVLGFGPKDQVLGLGLEDSILENCPVLGSRTALFFEPLKLGLLENARNLEENLQRTFWFFAIGGRLKTFPEDLFFLFFFGDRLKHFLKTFFLETV